MLSNPKTILTILNDVAAAILVAAIIGIIAFVGSMTDQLFPDQTRGGPE
jgi:hypothetical protein